MPHRRADPWISNVSMMLPLMMPLLFGDVLARGLGLLNIEEPFATHRGLDSAPRLHRHHPPEIARRAVWCPSDDERRPVLRKYT